MANPRRKSRNPPREEEKTQNESYVYDSDAGIASDDDESLEDSGSEVGWNSEDETAFGLDKKRDLSEDDDAYDEELQEGEILLSDLLSSSSKKVSSVKDNVNKQDYFDDDSESDNESEVGSEESEEESDDDSEDENDSEMSAGDHEKLLDAINKFAKGSNKKAADNGIIVSQSAKESEFSSSVGAKGKNAVSMEELLGALENSGEDLASIKQTLTGLSQAKGPPKHVEKVLADRMERSMSYKEKSEDMKKWQNAVNENRNTRTLDLAGDRRQLPSYRELVKSYEPSNELEKEVQMVLVSGKDEASLEQAEKDELGSSNLSVDELKERQKELAKVRALLFYEQMKRHRVNKIKSKAYHRILKRKKKREEEKGRAVLEGLDDDHENVEALKNATEEEAVRRIKERMSLKHRNTTKWSKMAAKHSHGNKALRYFCVINCDLRLFFAFDREAYHESVLLGHELVDKANNAAQEEGDNEHSEGDWSDDNNSKQKPTTEKASQEIVKALQAANEDSDLQGKYGGLYNMDFMKKAREKQRDRARDEATAILRDIDQMEEEMTRGDDSDEEDNRKGRKRSASDLEKLSAARDEMRSKLRGSMKLSKTTHESQATTEGENDNDGQNPWLAAPRSSSRTTEVLAGKKNKNMREDDGTKAVLIKKNNQNGKEGRDEAVKSEATKQDKNTKKKNTSKKMPPAGGKEPETATNEEKDSEDAKKELKPLIPNQKSQADLVEYAFAGPDFEQEFSSLKEKLVDDELDISGKKRQIETADKAGWGDWAGPGKVGVSDRVIKKRKTLLKNLEEKAASQRAGRADGQLANVILSERRVKTSAKYKLAEVPHPFKSREEYERSLQMPLGDEWNAAHIVKKNVKPEILTRAGRIIDPIKLSKNVPVKSDQNIKDSKNSKSKKRALTRTAKF